MGSYQQAVITTAGLNYITQAIAGQITLTFSHMAISSHAYPDGTNLAGLTTLSDVEMTVEPASVWVSGDTAGVRGLFSNQSVSTAFNIETVGVYATDGNTEILFSVSRATTADEMPAYNGVAPSSFIFTVQESINDAPTLAITVTTTGVATSADIADLQAQKQNVITGAASTVVSANLTEERALVSSGTGKIVVSSATAQDLGRLHGVTSDVQTQINGKQDTITGGASSIVSSNLDTGRALISSNTGKVLASAITSLELSYLDDAEGNIQTQINSLKTGKAIVNHQANDTTYGGATKAGAYGHVTLRDDLTATEYTTAEALSGYQGAVLKGLIDGKAPGNHASAATTYGVGNQSSYGHVKLRDNLTATGYEAGEALSGYQGAVLKAAVDGAKSTLPNVAAAGVSDSNLATGGAANAGSITLTPGLYIIKVTARFSANGTGYRQAWLSTTQTGTAKDFDSIVSVPAVDGAITSIQLTVMASITENTTFYIVVNQNSGSTLTLNTRYSIARLGNS